MKREKMTFNVPPAVRTEIKNYVKLLGFKSERDLCNKARRSMTEKMKFNKILKNADLVKEINDHYFTGCYQVRNEWMVDRSNLVIAVFNGQKSGTKNTVDYAFRKGIGVINVLNSI